MPLHSGSTEHAKYYSSALKLCPPIASWLNADVLKQIKTTQDTMFLQYTSSSLKVHEGGGGVVRKPHDGTAGRSEDIPVRCSCTLIDVPTQFAGALPFYLFKVRSIVEYPAVGSRRKWCSRWCKYKRWCLRRHRVCAHGGKGFLYFKIRSWILWRTPMASKNRF